MANKQKLSVVIPAYKAEKYIVNNIKNLEVVLSTTSYDYEIIVVVDGDIDKTYQKASRYSRNKKNVKAFTYPKNKGKGNAVRHGFSKATGDLIGFIDAGLDLDPNAMHMLLAHFEWYNADIIVGSKRHPASKIEYPWQRKILSFGYQYIVLFLFGLKIRDTQVGIKIFRAEVVKKILPRLLVKAFAFDIEMLAVANYLGYKRIFEAPINLKLDFSQSTIASKGFIRTSFWMLWDTLAVFYRLKFIDFYNYKNRKLWLEDY